MNPAWSYNIKSIGMKKKSQKKSILEKFNGREAKGNIENTALKSVVDILAGGAIGPGLAAISGKYSPIAGLLLIISGHYAGDKSGVLRTVGASTLAFGIAKSKDYQKNPEMDTANKRLTGLGNDILTAFHMKWKEEKKENDKASGDEEKPHSKPKEENTQEKPNKEDSEIEVVENIESKVQEKIPEQSKSDKESLDKDKSATPSSDDSSDISGSTWDSGIDFSLM